ncbi:cystathionine gamma-synthase [Nannochloropsis oceanica]
MSAANLPKKASIETILAQAGIRYQEITSISSRDIIPPLHLSTTFERDIDGTYSNGFVYSRHDHPTRALLEKVMTDIEEGAEWSAAFASGMQAATVLLQAFGANAYLILPNDLYQGIRILVRSTFEEWGLRNECVDMTDLGAVKEIMDRVFADAGTSRVLVWMESPSNPLLKVTDVRAIVALARHYSKKHGKDFLSILDTTWHSPFLLQALLPLGIDITYGSATKFLGGHSDLLAGVITGRKRKALVSGGGGMVDLEIPVRHLQQTMGGGLAPFDCWLLLRGLKTLPCRMRTHCENAQKLSRFFETHPRISVVHFPGLESHPGHGLHRAMMRKEGMDGSMLSIQMKGEEGGTEDETAVEEEVFKVLARLKIFRRATSLGATESLCEHRRSVEGPLSQTPRNLVRISVGLEGYEDLEEDWRQALSEEGS